MSNSNNKTRVEIYSQKYKNYYQNKKYIPKKKKKKNFILLTFFLILTIFSFYKIINWNLDKNKTNNLIDKIEEIAIINNIDDSSNTEYIDKPDTIENDYWYYIKMPLIQVNFSELIKKNNDTIAWIQINNTNVNYPIVQYIDNDYYLNHSFDKSSNEAGWVFMDYRNNKNFTSKNTIIYAHSRLDKTMFGSLSKVLKKTWYDNKDNHIIKISTPSENSLWQIFSVYKIKEESYYLTTDFENNNNYLIFLNELKKRSKYNFETFLDENSKIITLSTCYSNTERTVIHAKLIKKTHR